MKKKVQKFKILESVSKIRILKFNFENLFAKNFK